MQRVELMIQEFGHICKTYVAVLFIKIIVIVLLVLLVLMNESYYYKIQKVKLRKSYTEISIQVKKKTLISTLSGNNLMTKINCEQ